MVEGRSVERSERSPDGRSIDDVVLGELYKREMARRKLLGFVKYCKDDKQEEYFFDKYVIVIADALEKVKSGEIKRLIINIPPQYGKTTLVEEYFVPWFLGHNPHKQIIMTTYGADLSYRISRLARGTVGSEAYSRIFGGLSAKDENSVGVQLSEDNRSVSSWGLQGYRGGVRSTGIGGGITGTPAHLAIIDDPLKGIEQADSADLKDHIEEWFQSELYTRLSPDGAIIVVATRWALDDLPGRLIEKSESGEGEKYHVIRLPVLCDDPDNDPIGRKEGEPISTWRHTKEQLEVIARSTAPRLWNSVWQQRPIASGGELFKKGWLLTGSTSNLYSERILSIDSAKSKSESANQSVISYMGKVFDSERVDIITMDMGRWSYPELEDHTTAMYELFKPDALVIEDTSNGSALIQNIEEGRVPRLAGVRVVPVKVGGNSGSKEVRAEQALRFFMMQQVVANAQGPWVPQYIEQMTSFPKGKEDDIVDAVTQGVKYLNIDSVFMNQASEINNGVVHKKSYLFGDEKKNKGAFGFLGDEDADFPSIDDLFVKRTRPFARGRA